MDRTSLNELIISCTRNVLSEAGTNRAAVINAESKLYGPGGDLDSLGLVRLIAELEEEIYVKTNKSITLADEKAMSRKNSPFRSIASLSEYIESVLGNNG